MADDGLESHRRRQAALDLTGHGATRARARRGWSSAAVCVTASGAGWCTLARLDSGRPIESTSPSSRVTRAATLSWRTRADATFRRSLYPCRGLGVVALALWTLARSPLGALISADRRRHPPPASHLDLPRARAVFTAMATEVQTQRGRTTPCLTHQGQPGPTHRNDAARVAVNGDVAVCNSVVRGCL